MLFRKVGNVSIATATGKSPTQAWKYTRPSDTVYLTCFTDDPVACAGAITTRRPTTSFASASSTTSGRSATSPASRARRPKRRSASPSNGMAADRMCCSWIPTPRSQRAPRLQTRSCGKMATIGHNRGMGLPAHLRHFAPGTTPGAEVRYEHSRHPGRGGPDMGW